MRALFLILTTVSCAEHPTGRLCFSRSAVLWLLLLPVNLLFMDIFIIHIFSICYFAQSAKAKAKRNSESNAYVRCVCCLFFFSVSFRFSWQLVIVSFVRPSCWLAGSYQFEGEPLNIRSFTWRVCVTVIPSNFYSNFAFKSFSSF